MVRLVGSIPVDGEWALVRQSVGGPETSQASCKLCCLRFTNCVAPSSGQIGAFTIMSADNYLTRVLYQVAAYERVKALLGRATAAAESSVVTVEISRADLQAFLDWLPRREPSGFLP
jgi:hypothetical protein